MAPRLNIIGAWPSPITLNRGWHQATARPWNDESKAAMLRLVRGSAGFVGEATAHIRSVGAETVYTPPLFRSATGPWRQSGYEERHRLDIMERQLALPTEPGETPVSATISPNWGDVMHIDHRAFEGMWRMSEIGLREAFSSTRAATVLVAGEDQRPHGYALVGTRWGVSYLHRIAVDPDRQGRGVGADLVRAAVAWARGTLSTLMVLNVRPSNEGARSLYEQEGFTATGTSLHLLGYGD